MEVTSAVASPSKAYKAQDADTHPLPPLPDERAALTDTLSQDPTVEGTETITFGLTALRGD
jgi:hypothetical protein